MPLFSNKVCLNFYATHGTGSAGKQIWPKRSAVEGRPSSKRYLHLPAVPNPWALVSQTGAWLSSWPAAAPGCDNVKCILRELNSVSQEELAVPTPDEFRILPFVRPLPGVQNWEKSNPTKSSFIRKKKRFCLLQPYLVWKFLSHWSRKTSPKVRGTLKSLPKVVSKRSHQEECVQSAKTAKSVASCVASQVLQVADKLPSFPRKAEFSQIER